MARAHARNAASPDRLGSCRALQHACLSRMACHRVGLSARPAPVSWQGVGANLSHIAMFCCPTAAFGLLLLVYLPELPSKCGGGIACCKSIELGAGLFDRPEVSRKGPYGLVVGFSDERA